MTYDPKYRSTRRNRGNADFWILVGIVVLVIVAFTLFW